MSSSPTGTRSDAPTATPPGDLPTPPPSTFPCPTRTSSDAPTAAPPGGRTAPRPRTFSRPTGTRSDAPHFKHLQVASLPRPRTCTRPTGTRSHAPTAAPPGGLPTPRPRTSTRSTGTRSDAPTAAPQGPSLRRGLARPRVPRASVLTRPLQHLQLASPAPRPRTSSCPRGTRSRVSRSGSRGFLPGSQTGGDQSVCRATSGPSRRTAESATPSPRRPLPFTATASGAISRNPCRSACAHRP